MALCQGKVGIAFEEVQSRSFASRLPPHLIPPVLLLPFQRGERRELAIHIRQTGQIDKIWAAVSRQQAILTELLQERSAPPFTPPASVQAVAYDLEEDALSIVSEEADDQDVVSSSDDADRKAFRWHSSPYAPNAAGYCSLASVVTCGKGREAFCL